MRSTPVTFGALEPTHGQEVAKADQRDDEQAGGEQDEVERTEHERFIGG